MVSFEISEFRYKSSWSEVEGPWNIFYPACLTIVWNILATRSKGFPIWCAMTKHQRNGRWWWATKARCHFNDVHWLICHESPVAFLSPWVTIIMQETPKVGTFLLFSWREFHGSCSSTLAFYNIPNFFDLDFICYHYLSLMNTYNYGHVQLMPQR